MIPSALADDVSGKRSHRNALAAFFTLSLLLCGPSYAAWLRRPFDVGANEFDPWLALIPIQWPAQVAHAVLFAALALLYVRITRTCRPLSKWYVFAVWSVYLAAVPWLSPDVLFYLAKGWLQAQYGYNPYLTAVGAVEGFSADPIFASMAPSLLQLKGNYGPLFQVMSVAVARMSGGNPVMGLLLFKGLSAVALWGCFELIVLVARSTGRSREELQSWFLLNPLLLFNFLAAAHNDVLLMLLVLGCAAVWLRGRHFLGATLIGISISFKLVAVFLTPALAVFLALSRGGRSTARVWGAALLGAALGLAASLAIDISAFGYFGQIVANDTNFRSTIHMFLNPLLLALGAPATLSSISIGRVIFLLLGSVVTWLNARHFQRNPPVFLVVCSFELFLLAQYFVLPSMAEWYVLWPICFALCCPGPESRRWIRRITVLYMPVVVWSVVGQPEVVVFTQLVIVGFLSVTYGGYFLRKFRSEAYS